MEIRDCEVEVYSEGACGGDKGRFRTDLFLEDACSLLFPPFPSLPFYDVVCGVWYVSGADVFVGYRSMSGLMAGRTLGSSVWICRGR